MSDHIDLGDIDYPDVAPACTDSSQPAPNPLWVTEGRPPTVFSFTTGGLYEAGFRDAGRIDDNALKIRPVTQP